MTSNDTVFDLSAAEATTFERYSNARGYIAAVAQAVADAQGNPYYAGRTEAEIVASHSIDGEDEFDGWAGNAGWIAAMVEAGIMTTRADGRFIVTVRGYALGMAFAAAEKRGEQE